MSLSAEQMETDIQALRGTIDNLKIATKEARGVFTDLLSDFTPEHIDKMGLTNCGTRTREWLEKHKELGK